MHHIGTYTPPLDCLENSRRGLHRQP